MRGITSGLEPRRYAEGDLVEEESGMFDGMMDFFKEYGPMASLPMAAYEYATDPEKAKERYTKEGLMERHDIFKENIFDYTDPMEYATLPLYFAGPIGAGAARSIKGARIANKASKAEKAYKPGGLENILGSKAVSIGVPTATLATEVGYSLATDPEMKDIFSNDAVDDAQEDLETVTNDQKEKEKKEKEDANLTDEEKEKKKSFLEKMGQVFEAYGASQGVGSAPAGIEGGMIKGTAINTPEITRYQGGGIADMMPQEPMMMAGGGIAHFALGGAAIKKAIKVGIEKGIGVFNKAKKSASKETKKIKEERKVKPQSTKKSKSTDLALYDEAAAKAAAPTRTRGYLDFLPAPIAGAGVAAGKGVGQAGRALYDLKKPLAIPGALAATGLGIATYANSGDPEPTAEEIAKAKKDAAKAEADAAYKARQAARKGLTALPEIRAARALERAQESGRTEANFVDYIATFPASYTEKIGKDPEFAKQMMAGFIAMAKPTEGFVPRNAFVDFGEAAMAEGVRQEGEVPEALQTLQALQENPELKAAWDKNKRGEITPDKYLQTMAGLMNIAKDVVGSAIGRKIKPKENLVDANGLVVTGAELIKRYQEGDISAVQAYAQTLTPEEG
jgi:hypothetical protein